MLDRIRRPVFAEELEDYFFAGETDSESLEVLTRLQAALLVPMISGNRLLGFLAFGPKSSGDLYSQEDLANLRTLAVQSASLIESRRLYQDSLRRKRLETELEVARGILQQVPRVFVAGYLHLGRPEAYRFDLEFTRRRLPVRASRAISSTSVPTPRRSTSKTGSFPSSTSGSRA